MSDKKAQENNAAKRVNSLLILVIIILAFILAYSLLRKNNVIATSDVASDIKKQLEAEVQDKRGDDSGSNAVEQMDDDVLNQRIKKYILNNPEVILESVTAYQNKQMRDRDSARDGDIAEHYDDLVGHLPYIGPKNARHEIVEFYDYNCGYCKRAVSVINKVAAEDQDTKIYFADFPILGPSSQALAKVSVAAYMIKPAKFLDVHNTLMKLPRATAEKAAESLEELGFDADEILEKSKSREVRDFIEETQEFGRKLSVTGTPAFIVNKKFFGGAISYETIEEQLNN